MTPKEKAEELVGKYLAIQFGDFPTTDAKQCALIAVEEIIHTGLLLDSSVYVQVKTSIQYWEQVKQEIEKL